jgi:hypothetical protein
VYKFKLAVLRRLKHPTLLRRSVSGTVDVGKSLTDACTAAFVIVLASEFVWGGGFFLRWPEETDVIWHGACLVGSLKTSFLASGCSFESKLGVPTAWRTPTALRGLL